MNPSVMASPFVSKAFIPDLSSSANNAPSGTTSAFSFMGNSASNKDSFQFVADEMKASKK